jgi:hypothetical protein
VGGRSGSGVSTLNIGSETQVVRGRQVQVRISTPHEIHDKHCYHFKMT